MNNVKKLIIIGGRGNGTVVASTVEDINQVTLTWQILGFLNDDQHIEQINGYTVLGNITPSTISKYLDDENIYFYWALVSVNLRKDFMSRLNELKIPTHRFANIIHPTAVVSKQAKLGFGVSIHPHVNVGPNAKIGNHIHIFAQAMVGHDALINDFAYIANNACIGAKVILEEGAYIGINASIRENIVVGSWSIIGMGSVVIRSVSPNITIVGNPAREISRLN